MFCSSILVGYDGSELGKKALEKAVKLAEVDPSIEVHVVHAVQLPSPSLSEMEEFYKHQQEIADKYCEDGEKALQNVLEKYSSIPNKVSTFVAEGRPAEVILEQADQRGCDTIVLGCRGLSGIKELVLGSVSHQVVQRASAMVLIVK